MNEAQIIRFPLERRTEVEPWLTKAQIAKHLGVSERWIELRMKDDGLPYTRKKRAVRFKVSEVDAWYRKAS